MSLPCNRIAALSIVAVVAGSIGTEASAQQDSVQVDIRSRGSITVIENGRQLVPGTIPGSRTINILGLARTDQLFTDLVDGMSVQPEASTQMQRQNTFSANSTAGTGLSNTFFIRRVPVGTTDFSPPDEPGAATVDTWTERVITNDRSGTDPKSSVTIWTEAVYGN